MSLACLAHSLCCILLLRTGTPIINGFTELGDVEWRRYGNIRGWEESLSLFGIGIGGLKAVVLQMNGKRNSRFCLISLGDLLWFDS